MLPAGLALAALCLPAAAAGSVTGGRAAGPRPGSSVQRAYQFLNQMMDRYATGSAPRLVQSFTGGVLGRQHYTDSQTYDDALLIDASLAEGSVQGLARARVIGTALLYVQAHDPAHDGRIRAAYAPAPLRHPGDVHATDGSTDVGAMAWAGMALTQLHAATGSGAYLAGAERIGRWIQAHCRDGRGPGGYTGGFTARGTKIEWKSTEQNIDAYALFRMLAAQTGDRVWQAHAAWARGFVTAMWNAGQRRFFVGTTGNGKTLERHRTARGCQQLVLSRVHRSGLRRVGDLERAPPGRHPGRVQRCQLLPGRPQRRVVRGHRAPGRRAAVPQFSR
jgi:hypothetical protein